MAKSKNNHYIPQFYISQWKFNDKQVYYLDKNQSKIISTSPRNIFADRIWNPEVEGTFTQFENKFWIPVIDKILKNKTIDKLSGNRIKQFFIFYFCSLKQEKKRNVVEYHKTLARANADFDNKCIRDWKLSKEEVDKIQIHNDDDIADSLLLETFNPNKLPWTLNQFKRFSFGVKTIQEQDINYGQFLISDSPLLVKRRRSGGSLFQIIEAYLMMVALSPNLLVFGAKGVETFVALNNVPINIFIKEFNQEIYNNSKYIISNKKSFLEQFLS